MNPAIVFLLFLMLSCSECSFCAQSADTETIPTELSKEHPTNERGPDKQLPDEHGPDKQDPDEHRETPQAIPDPASANSKPAPTDRAIAAETKPASDQPETSTRGACTLHGESLVAWPHPGPAAIALGPRGWLVTGYERGRKSERAFLVSIANSGGVRTIATFDIRPASSRPRFVPPSVFVHRKRASIAFVDGRGVLRWSEVSLKKTEQRPRTTAIAQGIDARYAPAQYRIGDDRALAWTDGSRGSLGLRVALLSREGKVTKAFNVTTSKMSGAAPVFLRRGKKYPELYFLDARVGISALLRLSFTGPSFSEPSRAPRTPQVMRPISNVADPAQIALAPIAGRLVVAYPGIGHAASSTVGLVFADTMDAPTLLVPGVGYGLLRVAAIPHGAGAVFAAEVPQGRPPSAPREIHIIAATQQSSPGEPETVRLSPSLSIRGTRGIARFPSLAGNHQTLALAFTDPESVRLQRIRCDVHARVSR